MIFLGPLSIPAEALFCGHPAHFTVCKEFKKTACSIGPGNVRFHGLRMVQDFELRAIAAALGVSADWLLEGEDGPDGK